MKFRATPVAFVALCALTESFLPMQAQASFKSSATPVLGHAAKAQADVEGGGEVSKPSTTEPEGWLAPQGRGGTAMMPIKRAYDMLNQLERHFFGGYDILPFETTPEADKSLSQWISPTMGQLDISENDKEWKVAVDLPGLKKDDIRIELDHGMLTIEAERSEDKQQKGETFTRQERTFGMVRRALRLPDNVDPDKSKIKAKFDHGVLHVTIEKLPESAKSSSKKIEIQ